MQTAATTHNNIRRAEMITNSNSDSAGPSALPSGSTGQQDANPIPLLIGVAGHREINPDDKTPLQAAVAQVLTSLRREYRATPIVLLSPLAGDADLWVAEAALGVDRVSLAAVLPWPRDMDDGIGTPGGERWKCDLLAQASQVVVMPLPEGTGTAHVRDNATARDRQFDEIGRYIARNCQVLIAVWDGDRIASTNTAKVVRYHAEGAPAPYALRAGELDTAEQAAVCELRVRRRSPDAVPSCATTDPAPSAATTIKPCWTWPAGGEPAEERSPPKRLSQRLGPERDTSWWRRVPVYRAWATEWSLWWIRTMLLNFRRVLQLATNGARRVAYLVRHWSADHRSPAERRLRARWEAMNRFNRDAGRVTRRHADKVAVNCGYLIPDDEAAALPACVQRLRQHYGQADTAALVFQTWHWWIVLALFGLALAAVLCLEVHAHSWSSPVMLYWYLGLLLAGYVAFRITWWREHQGRWLDYRALAEALRVQVYWRWAGLERCAADHYLRHFRGELDWIRHALRAAYLTSGGHDPLPVSQPEELRPSLEAVSRRWIVDQREFFQRKAPLNDELEISFQSATRLFLAAAVVLAALQVLWQHAPEHPLHGLVLATFFCLLGAALLEKFSDIHAYAVLARRYRWMADLYRTADQRLAMRLERVPLQADDIGRARELLFELGCEALSENADWVVQHRQRPPVLPSG
jgi:hypothetical protein